MWFKLSSTVFVDDDDAITEFLALVWPRADLKMSTVSAGPAPDAIWIWLSKPAVSVPVRTYGSLKPRVPAIKLVRLRRSAERNQNHVKWQKSYYCRSKNQAIRQPTSDLDCELKPATLRQTKPGCFRIVWGHLDHWPLSPSSWGVPMPWSLIPFVP